MKITNANSKEWVLTDPQFNQYGRAISETVFEFKQNHIDQRIIDISKFTEGEIELIINTYGYTLYESDNGNSNIVEQYTEMKNWIIAECIFELEEFPRNEQLDYR
jgi:hypothetical protein